MAMLKYHENRINKMKILTQEVENFLKTTALL